VKAVFQFLSSLISRVVALFRRHFENIDVINVHVQEDREFLENKIDRRELEILDLRTLREYKQNHFSHAKLADCLSPRFRKELEKMDKNKDYLIYCATGFRSRSSLRIFDQLGFKTIYHLHRGLRDGWF